MWENKNYSGSQNRKLKDVRAKNFYNTDFLTYVRIAKKLGATDFVFEINRMENSTDFDKSALVTRHDLSAC